MVECGENQQMLTRQPPDGTNAFRLSDEDVPGLVVDLFCSVAVFNAYRAFDDVELKRVGEALLAQRPEVQSVYVKHRPKEARRVALTAEAAAPPVPLLGRHVESLVAHEAGIAYDIRPANGLSVGLYVDSSRARAWVRAHASGRTVLNLFSYTGGFALNARKGGATRAVNVDVSRKVLDWAAHNNELNGLSVSARDFISGDAFDWLDRFAKKNERFDLIIADPPGFATTKTSRFSAVNDYHRLVTAAARVLAPRGTLLALCNVHALSAPEFDSHLRRGDPHLRTVDRFDEGAVKAVALEAGP